MSEIYYSLYNKYSSLLSFIYSMAIYVKMAKNMKISYSTSVFFSTILENLIMFYIHDHISLYILSSNKKKKLNFICILYSVNNVHCCIFPHYIPKQSYNLEFFTQKVIFFQ